MASVTCPHCGSTATLPLPGLGDRLGAVFGAMFARRGGDLSFGNEALARKFNAGEISAYCRNCRRRFTRKTPPADAAPASAAPSRSLADRLRELERLRAEGLITETEYQSKRAQTIQDL
jgi:hypothetical protein